MKRMLEKRSDDETNSSDEGGNCEGRIIVQEKVTNINNESNRNNLDGGKKVVDDSSVFDEKKEVIENRKGIENNKDVKWKRFKKENSPSEKVPQNVDDNLQNDDPLSETDDELDDEIDEKIRSLIEEKESLQSRYEALLKVCEKFENDKKVLMSQLKECEDNNCFKK
uniref:TACC_C domain-containing protein n=1 Tax=Parastrongyloides trichosuri TaxID=131310 RepID=A0A0N4Z732_PARTI